MPGHPLPLALAAAAAAVLGILAPAQATPEPGPTVRGLQAAAPTGEAAGPGVAGLPSGAAATVDAPVASVTAAPLRRSGGQFRTGPPTAPGRGWQWPLAPTPRILARFEIGPFPWSPGHRGVDLAPAAGGGAPVLAAGPGVVRFAGMVAGRGVVSVEHGAGLRTTYEPVDATVTAGHPVAAGQVLGTLATIGGHCTPVACLHWGALLDERYIDPLGLLRPRDPPVLLRLE